MKNDPGLAATAQLLAILAAGQHSARDVREAMRRRGWGPINYQRLLMMLEGFLEAGFTTAWKEDGVVRYALTPFGHEQLQLVEHKRSAVDAVMPKRGSLHGTALLAALAMAAPPPPPIDLPERPGRPHGGRQ